MVQGAEKQEVHIMKVTLYEKIEILVDKAWMTEQGGDKPKALHYKLKRDKAIRKHQNREYKKRYKVKVGKVGHL